MDRSSVCHAARGVSTAAGGACGSPQGCPGVPRRRPCSTSRCHSAQGSTAETAPSLALLTPAPSRPAPVLPHRQICDLIKSSEPLVARTALALLQTLALSSYVLDHLPPYDPLSPLLAVLRASPPHMHLAATALFRMLKNGTTRAPLVCARARVCVCMCVTPDPSRQPVQ